MLAAAIHLPALTGLRFVLAIWVILFHLTGKRMMLEGWAHSLPESAQAILRGGYLAVGAFFVLSGFVLARSYGSTSWNRTSLIRYGVGRFARIYPTYLLSLLIVSPFILEFLFSVRRSGPPLADKATALTIYSFVLQGWTPPSVHWNTPAWSLSCELFFYLCFPLIAACLPKTRWLKISVAVIATAALAVLVRRVGVPSAWKPLHHLADFLLGIAAAGVYEFMVEVRSGWAGWGLWLYAPAAAVGAICIAVSQSMDLNNMLRPVNAALIVGLALGGGLPARALSTRVATDLGKASYAMYILHVPLLWWYKRSWLHESGYLPQTASALVYLATVVVLSAVVSQQIEEPWNRRLRAWAVVRTCGSGQLS